MQENTLGNDIRWTWADLVSSYRFWAIAFFFMVIMGLFFVYSVVLSSLYQYGLTTVAMGKLQLVYVTSSVLGVIPAWLMSRVRSYYPLFFIAAFAITGVVLLYFGAGNYYFVFFGVLLLGVCVGIVALLVPAYIAKATNSVEVFILVFGFLGLLKIFGSSIIMPLMSTNMNVGFIVIIFSIITATALLLPIEKNLFNTPPSQRYVKADILHICSPLMVFLAFFIPFYFVFWFYRIHKDIRSFTQSATLLTPQGAAWSSLFVPFAAPIMLSILNDRINQQLLDQQKEAGCKTGVLILLALFLPMVAASIIQDQMNRLIELSNHKVDLEK